MIGLTAESRAHASLHSTLRSPGMRSPLSTLRPHSHRPVLMQGAALNTLTHTTVRVHQSTVCYVTSAPPTRPSDRACMRKPYIIERWNSLTQCSERMLFRRTNHITTRPNSQCGANPGINACCILIDVIHHRDACAATLTNYCDWCPGPDKVLLRRNVPFISMRACARVNACDRLWQIDCNSSIAWHLFAPAPHA